MTFFALRPRQKFKFHLFLCLEAYCLTMNQNEVTVLCCEGVKTLTYPPFPLSRLLWLNILSTSSYNLKHGSLVLHSEHKIFPTPDNDPKYFISDTLVYKFMKGVSRRAGDVGGNLPLCGMLQSARFNSLIRSNFVVVQIWNYACMRSFDLLSWKMNISWKQFTSAFRNDKKAVGSVSTTNHNMKLRFSLL